jgi:hypothetical protein
MHRIHLKGPWQSLGPDGPVRVKLPQDWEAFITAATGELRLARRFHRPTGIDDDTRLAIVVPEAWNVRSLTINGREVPQTSTSEGVKKHDATEEIRAHAVHELKIAFVVAAAAPFLVAMEISAT